MVVSSERINIITDQGLNTGIGRYAYSLYSLLKNDFPNLVIYQIKNFDSVDIPNAKTFDFINQAKSLIEFPFVKYINLHKLRNHDVFKGQNIHLCGTDYSLSCSSESCVATVHDYYPRLPNFNMLKDLRTLFSELYINYYNMILPKHIKRCTRIVVVSSKVQLDLKMKLGLSSIVIPIWVSDQFRPRDKELARARLNLPLNEKLLLNVSGGGANKNLPTLEKISKGLSDKIRLVKIGHPIHNVKVINRNKVTEEDYPYYFNACDIYVNTSTVEGFGIPLIESMKSGLPVISPRTSPFDEILGNAGIFVENPMDEKNYLQAIESVFDYAFLETHRKLSIECGARYSCKRIKDSLIRLYSESFNC